MDLTSFVANLTDMTGHYVAASALNGLWLLPNHNTKLLADRSHDVAVKPGSDVDMTQSCHNHMCYKPWPCWSGTFGLRLLALTALSSSQMCLYRYKDTLCLRLITIDPLWQSISQYQRQNAPSASPPSCQTRRVASAHANPFQLVQTAPAVWRRHYFCAYFSFQWLIGKFHPVPWPNFILWYNRVDNWSGFSVIPA